VTDEQDLRAALRRFPNGVAVLTIDDAGERLGLTIGTLVSLSRDPPLVGVSVSQEAAMHELLRRAGGFSVSLLSAEQVALAQHFARGVPPIGLWRGIGLREGTRAPLLEGSVAWLECGLFAEHPVGDHTLFVGRVERAELGLAQLPLLYFDRSYRSL